uniref:Protein kinase domain-containing protein n=1 Tax=Candidatus Kentrum sp. DK TaxID=2126562 RepID=A0A450S3Z2_9GAMM|nr:MAG: Protein kinase domain-containing protein [Candidatus Kentron sp. DK]
MSEVRKATTTDGAVIEYHDEIIGSGAVKDVYFATDDTHAVAFFRDPLDAAAMERLKMITGRYRERIFDQEAGEYWKKLFCWPTWILHDENNRVGVLVPRYERHFFFEHGSFNNDMLNIRNREKEGKWFASATNRNRFLAEKERGNWLDYLRVCILISRAVKRLHAAGLAHSDLSYKNVLVDPTGGNACIIDIDGLVVPGKFPPDVIGTPDFIAPEVVRTAHLDKSDPNRHLPCIDTDRHALAVLIYMYLFLRHPLRGGKVHDPSDCQKDEDLSMGEKALFVEHPLDRANRIRRDDLKPEEEFWSDTDGLPYTVAGPYLSKLFERAFMDGLHSSDKRPTADEWEQALVKTVDLIQPCQNKGCAQQWYVFDNTKSPKCPFCATPFKGQLPIFNLYSTRQAGKYLPDNHRLMVYTGQSLFPWHINRLIVPNERLTPEQKKRVGYFSFHKKKWLLVNERMEGMFNASTKTDIPAGSAVELTDGLQILLSREHGGRLAVVQVVAV